MSTFSVGPFRFTEELMHAATGDARLDSQNAALRVLATIVYHGASSGSCFLTDARIAEHNRIDTRTVSRAVKLLESLGYIAIDRGDRRGCRATVYRIPLDRGGSPATLAPTPRMDAPSRNAIGETGHGYVRNGSPETGHSYVRNGMGETGHGERRNRTSAALKPDISTPETGHSYVHPTAFNQIEPENLTRADLDSRSRSVTDPESEKTPERPRFPTLAPPPPEGATCEELCKHAIRHRSAASVIRPLAERFGIDPSTQGGILGKHLHPLPKADPRTQRRVLEAARWADRALEPRNAAHFPPLDGFLLKATGSEIPWPVVRGSEAEAAADAKPSPPPPRPYVHPDVAEGRGPDALFSEAPRPRHKSTPADELAKFEAFKRRRSAPPPMPDVSIPTAAIPVPVAV